MNRAEHLLTCLAEECTEVGQRVTKALRFGLNEVQPGQPLTNAQRIVEELNDLWSVAYILLDEGIIQFGNEPSGPIISAKRAKIEKFMAIARDQGALRE